MQKAFLILGVAVLVIIGAIAVSYFFIEKTIVADSLKNIELSIKSVNENGDNIINNYFILTDGFIFKQGKTVEGGYIKDNVPYNKSFSVFFDDDNIYSSFHDFNSNLNIQQLEVVNRARAIGQTNLSYSGTFWADNPINLSINSTDVINNMLLCIHWSRGIISSTISGFDKYIVPSRVKMEKCYLLESNETSLIIPITYKKYNTNNNEDFLEVMLVFGNYDYTRTLKFEENSSYYKIEDVKLKIE